MNRTLLFILLSLISNQVYSQNEKNIWFFGENAGLDFNSGTPVPIMGALITDEGCSSIADSYGQLLFYTNGVTVWDKNHQIMQNGTNLVGHISSSQSATIIKKPGSNSIYYIFTLDAELGSNGFRYSLVDISLNSGLGSVIEKNVHIRNLVGEKLVIIKHANNFDFWVTVHGFGGVFYSYLVTEDGVSITPVESNVGYNLPLVYAYAKGMMKASTDGTRIAVTNSIHYQSVELFDFNNASGELSNGIFLFHGHNFSSCSGGSYYGIEFSPNGNLLYVSNAACPLIYQFDLTAPDISTSAVEITVPSYWSAFKSALQLAPDNKIYVSIHEKNYLGVINHPNNIGLACDYQEQGINLLQGTNARLGLPISYTINNLDIIYELHPNCDNVGVSFSIDSPLSIENVIWDFGDGNTSNQFSITHQYYNSGTYTVTLTVNTNMGILSINKSIYINVVNTVELPSVASSQTFCIDDNATLNDIAITGENIKWYNDPINGNELPVSTSLTDGMTYYVSQTIDDCESLRVAVTITIQNTPAPQGENSQTLCINQNPTLNDLDITGENIIWYDSLTGTIPLSSSTPLTNGATYYATQTVNDCESVNRLAVTVELLESLNAFDYTEVVCDVANDNVEIVDLSLYNSSLIQNHSDYSFEYYASENEALNQIASAMITSYTEYPLTIGWNTIYVRIDSSFGCYKIVELKLQLVRSPIVAIPDIVALCEGKNVVLNAGIGFDSYLWSTGETTSSITVFQEGEYWVTVSQIHDNVICSTTKEISVTLSNVAEITDIEIHDWTNTENTIIIHVNGLGDYEYSIDGIFYQDSNVFSNLSSGTYSVYVRDKNQCGIVKEQIYLLSYPKFFTPNGDGIHDSWYINFSYYEPNLKVLIFDRYGKLLKELRQNESWDGKFNGNDMPSNDYWFVVTRGNRKIHKGHFTLKR